MSSSRTPHSAIRRMKSQVYVEIPPSPLHTPRPSAVSLSSISHLNQPLSPTRSNIAQDATLKKRKLSNPPLPATKKSKVEITSKPHKENATAHTTSDKYYVDVVICTGKNVTKSGKERSCNSKYCRACIKNRYSHDAESMKAAETKKEKIPVNYTKAKGLEPLGYVAALSKYESLPGSAPHSKQPCNVIQSNQNVEAKKPANTLPVKTHPPSGHTTSSNPIQNSAHTKAQKKPAAKPLPKLSWQRLPVAISTGDVESRILIREFVLRFQDTVGKGIGKTNLEELECLVAEESMDWVSEGCAKAVILGLLGVLAGEEDSSAALVLRSSYAMTRPISNACTRGSQVIKKAMKEIRSAGINLTRLWSSLADLRDVLCAPDDDNKSTHSDDSESSEDRIIIEFPDPLPPPEDAQVNSVVRSTRSSTSNEIKSSITIVNSYQLGPVIVGLIETVIESHTIREELEDGTKYGKEITRDVREGIKRENEKWEKLKQTHETLSSEDAPAKIKEDRQDHKDAVQGLENALKVVLSGTVPRFGPLGTDHDGRVYWALSPGIRDREFAQSLITAASATNKSKKVRKPIRRPKSAEERATFKSWSWFLAVQGKKPSGVDVEGGDEPGWWVFWETEEIRKLASWISIRNGLEVKAEDSDHSGASATTMHLKNLVKNLQDYSTILEWRCKGEEEML
ncbi:hypothetical protein PQX77_003194 [Marasmius sp. AFHP31]|nr:hypothetical protein PQX77_004227 [Marasmius sp. AFHP31]KAK1233650.1 hypothetical protein PQX77_003194 [Marasmius sp. AFHP31]